ncbi:hypothetical protein CDD80_99 [Ophiocordyceps camponoti-rufipedis]|uniref:BHLH domain-containing protein n=1 Tax=Ophiocordyceps camponoti-rufipedis TaxID=2004952 RepID=A0A2C5ZA37_9HYPO|nr:hypothetical protein CDD80_99 [Ophiocordyceps camponoti-rufipedis]
MIAVQLAPSMAPDMGSSPPPESDPVLPFGYALDPVQEPSFDVPNPAPGTPILSENDSRLICTFFEDMTSNHYNTPSFGEGITLSEAWINLPPQFMGTATSYGSHDPSLQSQPFTAGDQPPHQPRVMPLETQLMPHSTQSFHHLQTAQTHQQHHPLPHPQPHQQQHHPLPHPQPHQQHHQQPQSQPHSQPPSQPHQQSHQLHHHQHHQLYPQHPQHPQNHHPPSADVLNAAATLVQNAPLGRVPAPRTSEPQLSRLSHASDVGHRRHQLLEEFTAETRRSSLEVEHGPPLVNWMWGSSRPVPAARRPTVPLEDFQWGSDASFGPAPQGYAPEQPAQAAADVVSQTHMSCLDCLKVNPSAANTRTNSPAALGNNVGDCSAYIKREEDHGVPPRKRRKSDNVKEPVDVPDDNQNNDVGKRRRSRTERLDDASPAPPSRRRKSTANGTKPPRENLTEEQKRENHIRSEQKRRTLIKEGFDDLCDLVPGLKGGGFSKSTMLSLTAEWLEELIGGNRTLVAQLAGLSNENEEARS